MEVLPIIEWLDPQGILRTLKKFEKRQNGFFQRILDRYRRARELERTNASEELTDDNERSSANFMDILLHVQEEGRTPFIPERQFF